MEAIPLFIAQLPPAENEISPDIPFERAIKVLFGQILCLGDVQVVCHTISKSDSINATGIG